MKISIFFSTSTVLMLICCLTALYGCSSIDEGGTGYYLRLNAVIDKTNLLNEVTFTTESPCHIVAFAREKECSPFFYIFEENAYLSNDGQLKWVNKFRYWPGTYCKFVAFWPADSNVILDETGNVVSADCSLIAVSEPLCHFSENPTLTFIPYNHTEETLGQPIGF